MTDSTEPNEQRAAATPSRVVWWKLVLGGFLVYTQVSTQIRIHLFHDPRYLTPDNASQGVGFYGMVLLLTGIGIWLLDSGIKGKKSKT
jgi:hypothetical protein